MKLTSENVHKILVDCLYRDEEIVDGKPPEGTIVVEGLTIKVGFHPGRLESHRTEVRELLEQLPNEYRETGGGGWTFLNMCMTKDDEQWGEQRNCQELLLLGLGLKLVDYCLPREMWSAMPGGVPYIVFRNREDANAEKSNWIKA